MIQLPMEPAMASLTVHTPLCPSSTMASIAGHTVSTMDSIRITPMKIPMTRIPTAVRGATGGATQKAAMTARQTRILINREAGI